MSDAEQSPSVRSSSTASFDRSDYWAHLLTFSVANACLVALWWFVTGHGYFWPGWVVGGWSIYIVQHTWQVFGRRPLSCQEAHREMDRGSGGHA
jgi:2TM domain